MKKIYLVILLMAGTQNIVSSQCTTAFNQLFKFPFSNSSADISFYNQPILNFGSVTYGTDRFGNANSSLNTFSGSVFLTNDVGGNFKCQFPMTFSSWVFINTLNSRNPIFCNEDAATDISGVYVEALSNGTIKVRVGDNPGGTEMNYTTTNTVTTGQWFQLTTVLTTINDIKVYVNGVEYTGSYSGGGTSLGYLNIGGTAGKIGSGVNGTGTNVYLNGQMDDVMFWNVALQSFQITALYENHVDALVEDTVTICEGENTSVNFPFNSCDISWSNGDNDSTCNISGIALGLGTHSIFMTAYDDMNIEYTDSVVVIVQACAGIEENGENMIENIYPNPAKGMVHIGMFEPSEYRILLQDMAGKNIFEKTVSGNSTDMNVENIPAGIYLLRITSENKIQTQKLIIE